MEQLGNITAVLCNQNFGGFHINRIIAHIRHKDRHLSVVGIKILRNVAKHLGNDRRVSGLSGHECAAVHSLTEVTLLHTAGSISFEVFHHIDFGHGGASVQNTPYILFETSRFIGTEETVHTAGHLEIEFHFRGFSWSEDNRVLLIIDGIPIFVKMRVILRIYRATTSQGSEG